MKAKTILGIIIAAVVMFVGWKIGGMFMEACMQQAANNLVALF